jgi:hypothetical protein
MYVYFITALRQQELKRIKIGSSSNPEKRLRRLQTGSPYKLTLLGTVKCKSPAHARSIEKYAHNIFYKQRRNGEWFHLSRKHLDQIKSLIQRAAEMQPAEVSDAI